MLRIRFIPLAITWASMGPKAPQPHEHYRSFNCTLSAVCHLTFPLVE